MIIHEFIPLLRSLCEDFGVMLTESQLHSFAVYQEMLLEWNTKMNLTAITEPKEIAAKHFIDSLAILKAVDLKENMRLIDVGTGAGFPGMPIKLLRPDLPLTLLDSLNKRLIFLRELADRLQLSVQLIHGRAEEFSRQPQHREQYDLVTARAVSPLPSLCEYCLPYVCPGGIFAAMKGPALKEELAAAENAISALGGELSDVYSYQLPEGDNRSLVLIKKTRLSPANYPRSAAKISKSPL